MRFKFKIRFIFDKNSKLNTKNAVALVFSLIVLSEIYLGSYRLNYLMQLLFLVALYVAGAKSVSFSFVKTITPLLLVFGIGLLVSFFYPAQKVDVFKDILYFSKPIIGLCLSFVVFKTINDARIFFKVFIYLALFCAAIHLIGLAFFSNFLKSSISDIRDGFGFDNFLEIFGFFFLLFMAKTKIQPLFRKNWHRHLALVVLFVSVWFYFSRTMILMMVLLAISFYGYAKLNSKSIKIIGVFVLFIALFVVVLNSIKIDRNSKGIEALFYKIKMAPSEVFNSKIDREDHKQLWDHWRAYEAKRAFAVMDDYTFSEITGTGFGSLVNLKFFVPLSEKKMKYISRLHNGYVFIFYKTGFLGLLLYAWFLIILYKKVYDQSSDQSIIMFSKIISSIALFYFVTTLIISGIFISKDIVIFILGGALYLRNKDAVIINQQINQVL